VLRIKLPDSQLSTGTLAQAIYCGLASQLYMSIDCDAEMFTELFTGFSCVFCVKMGDIDTSSGRCRGSAEGIQY